MTNCHKTPPQGVECVTILRYQKNSMTDYNPEDFELENEDDEYLTDVMVNVGARTFVMFSNEGTERKVECDTVDEFMEVLEMVRVLVDDEIVRYISPVVSEPTGKLDF